jgi:acetoin:2,6-dichlorophenolindophenol oxidoreductase subunit alpha
MTSKALITESDVRRAIQDGSNAIHVNGDPIITPLAASSINELGIRIVQDGSYTATDSSIASAVASCPDSELNLQGRDSTFLLKMYAMMWRVRMFEEAMGILFKEKHLVGFLHLSIGQEAVSTGSCAALKPDDYLTLTHRGHGQMVARGSDVKKMAAELLGKATGYCKGKGGSVHLADFQNGILGANGIIGASLVIATGAAMSAKIRKSGQLAVAFFGDGATNQGAFHEALNYAAIKKLPVIFICENNQYAVSTSCSQAAACTSFASRGAAYGMDAMQIDGMNILEVYDTVKIAANRARKGDGPTFIECMTYRTRGHWEGETTDLRPSAEREQWKKRDAIERLKRALLAANLVSQQQLEDLFNGVVNEIAEAVRFAEQSPYPDSQEAMKNVMASG